MAAQYRVTFADGEAFYVFSADAKSFKPQHLREATRKAVEKAKAKHGKTGKPKSAPVECRCVG